jgi:lysophospholipase L1-like esterase
MVSAVMLTLGVVFSARGMVVDFPWIQDIQRKVYSTNKNIWQARADCAVHDEQLIYKPKNGSCEFDNLEYRTRLNFSDSGRSTGPKPKGDPIVVLGDSHAMGWGVNDDETFSAQLQGIAGRPVYNLAVSSYGTARELLRLEESGLQEKAETIIIQYCDNDREENVGFKIPTPSEAYEKFRLIQPGSNSNNAKARVDMFLKAYEFTFFLPMKQLRKAFTGDALDFGPHYEPLIDTLKKSSGLENKQIIIFYINPFGRRFRGFPTGRDKQLPNVYFLELELDANDYYVIDDHMNGAGHKRVAAELAEVLKGLPLSNSAYSNTQY